MWLTPTPADTALQEDEPLPSILNSWPPGALYRKTMAPAQQSKATNTPTVLLISCRDGKVTVSSLGSRTQCHQPAPYGSSETCSVLRRESPAVMERECSATSQDCSQVTWITSEVHTWLCAFAEDSEVPAASALSSVKWQLGPNRFQRLTALPPSHICATWSGMCLWKAPWK